MPCYHPLRGFRSRVQNHNGNYSVVFKGDGFTDACSSVDIPCGRCIGCRLERSRQWAVRCVHEASLWPSNCFVTLTYASDQIPAGGSLDGDALTKFLKRLRSRVGRVRFFACGEYGEKLSRPHYHLMLFGYDFPDRELWSIRDGVRLYRSKLLEELWPFGFSTIGEATFESAAYIARYCVKKINGEQAKEHYTRIDEYGVMHEVKPEFARMSLKPGIGADWFKKFKSDLYPDDFVVVRGVKMKIPKYYDTLLGRGEVETLEALKRERLESAYEAASDNTWQRLKAKETVKRSKSKMLKRGIEQ